MPLREVSDGKRQRQRMALGFGALLALAILFGLIVNDARNAAAQHRQAERWYVHTFQVLLTAEALESSANAAMRGSGGYLITGDPRFLGPYQTARTETARLFDRLAVLTRDNSVQRVRLHEVAQRLQSLFGELDKGVALRRAGDAEKVTAVVRSGVDRQKVAALFDSVGAFKRDEQQLLSVRSIADETANRTLERHYFSVAAVGLTFLLLVAIAGVWTIRAQQRLRALTRRLHESATTDELTGLANRRRFTAAIEVASAVAARSGAPLSVALLDLDHFKRVNDRFGHAGGDAVLRGFAELASKTVRAGDLVARIGGEEFAILMPDTDQADARRVCDRLRAAMAGTTFGSKIRATVSTGVALAAPEEGWERTVRRADEALYSAKAAGRNQVRLAA